MWFLKTCYTLYYAELKEPMSFETKPSVDSASHRSFVFLQGPTSGVFRDLGRALAARGHDVLRINFCLGDMLFWRGKDTVRFKGKRDEWPDYLARVLEERQATDIVYFADRFPYHREAQKVARSMGVRCVSMEYGYIRPDWLILEEGGQSAYSHFPNDLDQIRKTAADLPALNRKPLYEISSTEEAIKEAGFHLTNALTQPFNRHYRPERVHSPLIEFPGYIPRFIRRARNAKVATAQVVELQKRDVPQFIVPLQMQGDYQIRANAPVGYQYGFVNQIMESFKRAAPKDALLIFKLHPMDNGLINWARFVAEAAERFGLTERVHFLDGGDLGPLFKKASGCIVVNSTTGMHSLLAGVPTKTMGVAVYDIEGITHQGSLDAFWDNPNPARPADVQALTKCLAHGIHVRGTVYGKGRKAFVANALERLEATDLHKHGLYKERPPRLQIAQALRIATDWEGEADQPPRPKKRIAITGASTGLGAALAVKLAEPGISFALCARNIAPFESLVEQLRAKGAEVEFASVDLAAPGAPETWIEDIWQNGPIDMLILNAGIFDGRDLDGNLETPDRAAQLISTNLTGAITASLAATELMQKRGSGHLVFVSSLAALGPHADAPSYSASKAGLTAFARAMREGLLGTNVDVTVLHPGHIKSRQTEQHVGPMPGLMSAEDAADKIATAISSNKTEIHFPRHLRFALQALNCLPWRWQAKINAQFRFRVKSDADG